MRTMLQIPMWCPPYCRRPWKCPHPTASLDDLTVTVSTMDQTVDLRTDMQLSENARAACLETGVKALREVLAPGCGG